MPETLTLRQSPSKMRWVVVGSLVFVAIGLWMIVYPEGYSRSPEYIRFIGFASVIFFGLAAVASVGSVLKPTELVLGPDGFQVRGRRPKAVVPWSDVERFFIVKIQRTKLVSYVLKPDARAALPGVASLSASFSLTGADGHLPAYLDRTPQEVCELLEAWRIRSAS
ncbi:MAG: STM3941 family protein [Pseudomonadota bacterium]|nr:STM3941 family protein [Pseudomonadota bacterium]